jgi:hypothetical protein
MNWKTHSEKLNGLYKGNNTGFRVFAVAMALLVMLLILIGISNRQAKMTDCIDGLFNGEYTDTACETCEKLINRK